MHTPTNCLPIQFDIVIPAFNAQAYIADCLESIKQQTYPHFNVYIVDDGSTDQTGDIIQLYAKKDPRFRYFRQANQGLSQTRNNGFQAGVSPYVLYVDGDDILMPKTLEHCATILKAENADLILFDCQHLDSSGRPGTIFPALPQSSTFTQAQDFLTNEKHFKLMHSAWGKCYRRAFLNTHHIHFIPNLWYEDLPHTWEVVCNNPRFIYLNQPLYGYRQTPRSISKQFNNPHTRDIATVIEHCQTVANRPHIRQQLDSHSISIQDILAWVVYHQVVISSLYGLAKAQNRRDYIWLKSWLQQNFPNILESSAAKEATVKEKILANGICHNWLYAACKIRHWLDKNK